jgi:glycosyltransferase involved in cell wall biosynthesis
MENKRLKLGVIFNFNPSWMGGIIYILNLIKTLNFLDASKKPEILLFYGSGLKKFVDQISYPELTAIPWEFPSVYNGFVKSWISGKNEFINEIISRYDPDALYPVHDFPVRSGCRTRLVSWYADLQHEYYPEFFRRRKIFERTLRIKFILRNSHDLVVSSNAVASDFKKFFKIHDHLRMHVFHFVSVIDDLDDLDLQNLQTKYKLPEKYYIVSNQFHKHKNHAVLLRALISLNQRGFNAHLAFTGRFPDASHSQYMQDLHSMIDKHNLRSQISFMGIIPRNEQLFLMKHAQAVIQPSLFEGWSTVIEDAISLQAPVIASGLPVNIEQLGSDGNYFEPHDHEKLADLILNFPRRELSDVLYEDYKTRIHNAAKSFLNIFNS